MVPGYDGDRPGFQEALHEEINRLPMAYRTAVVLCVLEDQPAGQVARQLRWPVGVVRKRLSRALASLRVRLARRGYLLSWDGPTPEFLGDLAADLPESLIDSTVAAVTREPRSPNPPSLPPAVRTTSGGRE
jgi:hypothetical protein